MFGLKAIIWTNGHLKTHLQTVHENAKLFTCLIWSKSFGQKGNLDTHFNVIHKNIKTFTCNNWNKSIGQNRHLKPQGLWLSWWNGCFWHQRSAVEILTSANIFIYELYWKCIEKDENKEKCMALPNIWKE